MVVALGEDHLVDGRVEARVVCRQPYLSPVACQLLVPVEAAKVLIQVVLVHRLPDAPQDGPPEYRIHQTVRDVLRWAACHHHPERYHHDQPEGSVRGHNHLT